MTARLIDVYIIDSTILKPNGRFTQGTKKLGIAETADLLAPEIAGIEISSQTRRVDTVHDLEVAFSTLVIGLKQVDIKNPVASTRPIAQKLAAMLRAVDSSIKIDRCSYGMGKPIRRVFKGAEGYAALTIEGNQTPLLNFKRAIVERQAQLTA